VASLIGHSISGGSRFLGAILATIIFAAVYIFWNHYPHGLLEGFRFPERIAELGAAYAQAFIAAVFRTPA
jgi:hypothetical protein